MGTPMDMMGVTLWEELQPGYLIEAYALLERIGYGGQAVIWSAWDRQRERVVAIKLIPAADGNPLAEPSIFEREAQIVATLQHPNILPLYSFGATSKFHYLSMRYIGSGSLKGRLVPGPVPPSDVLCLAAQIVSALEYVHARGVVHRDLKPSNVLLDFRGRVYLADFGLARRLPGTTVVLHTGHATPPYAPPEQYTRSKVTPQSDIYSLGILLFEMLTGSLPWGGEVALAARQLDTEDELPDPRQVNPALPAALAGALRTLTAADMADRPASVLDAFDLVAGALRVSKVSDATREIGISALEEALRNAPPRLDAEALEVEDAQYLLQRASATWDPNTERFETGITRFMIIDAVYSQAERYGLSLENSHRQFMLRGSLTHDHHLDFWWRKMADPQARARVCEQAIANDGEGAAGRALALLLSEPTSVLKPEGLSAPTLERVVDVATGSANPTLRANAFDLLNRLVKPAAHWQTVGFTPTGDIRLANLALGDGPQAERAARLIGHSRSETAVQVLMGAQEKSNSRRALTALMEVRDAAGSLPRLVPASVRLRVVAELARQQLLRDRATLVRTYLSSALGGALGLGFHVYVVYRLPSFLDAARILNALGGGLLFGLLLGLGIFLTRLVANRLHILPLAPRLALGVGVGALVVNLSIVSYYNLFLSTEPTGWPIAMGSVLIALGFGAGAALTGSRLLRILLSATSIGLGIGLSWQAHLLNTWLDPILNYEYGWPVQRTALMIVVTSLLMASAAHVFDLPRELMKDRGAAGA
jgi:serine/threonine protein kinase